MPIGRSSGGAFRSGPFLHRRSASAISKDVPVRLEDTIHCELSEAHFSPSFRIGLICRCYDVERRTLSRATKLSPHRGEVPNVHDATALLGVPNHLDPHPVPDSLSHGRFFTEVDSAY